jgi:hypothetical protein
MNCRGRKSPENNGNGAQARRATQGRKFCVALRAYATRSTLSVGLRRRQFLCRPPGYGNEQNVKLQNSREWL